MKKLLWGFIIGAGILILGSIILNWYARYKIRQNIEAAIKKNDLNIEYKDLEISLLKGRVAFQKFSGRIPCNTKEYLLSVKNNGGSLKINGISWWTLLRYQEFVADDILLESPSINITLEQVKEKSKIDTIQASPRKDSTHFTATIDKVAISNARLTVNYAQDSTKKLTIDTINLNVYDISYNANDTLSFDLIRNLDFDLRRFNMTGSRKLHRISIGQIAGNTQDSLIKIEQIQYTPLYSKKEFSKQLTWKKARMEIAIPRITLTGLGVKEVLAKNIHLNRLQIEAPDIYVYLDKNMLHDSSRYVHLPQSQFAKLDPKITIDSIFVERGNIRYEELYSDINTPGRVDFNNLNVVSWNVSNDPAHWEQDNNIYIKAECDLYDNAPVYLTVQIPMSENPWTYYYQGAIRNFSLAESNKMLEEAAKIYFKTGFIDELVINVTANPELATGNLDFFYKNIDIQFLDGHRDDFTQILYSVIESLAFPTENIKTEKHRVGQLYFKRITSRSIFNHLWKTILSGMKSTILPNIILPKELKHKKVKPGEKKEKNDDDGFLFF